MGGWCTERVNAYPAYQTRKHAVGTTGAVIIQLITTIIFVNLLLLGKLTIKLIKISYYLYIGIGSS